MPPASLCVSYGVELEIPGEQSFTTVFTKARQRHLNVLQPMCEDTDNTVVDQEQGSKFFKYSTFHSIEPPGFSFPSYAE